MLAIRHSRTNTMLILLLKAALPVALQHLPQLWQLLKQLSAIVSVTIARHLPTSATENGKMVVLIRSRRLMTRSDHGWTTVQEGCLQSSDASHLRNIAMRLLRIAAHMMDIIHLLQMVTIRRKLPTILLRYRHCNKVLHRQRPHHGNH